MTPAGLAGFTPQGLDTLARILRKVVTSNAADRLKRSKVIKTGDESRRKS